MQVAATGGLRESANLRKIEESIRIILGTNFGERLMRPTFGCNLKSLVFAPINDATINLARQYAEDGLKRWEPRIEVLAVNVNVDERTIGVLQINITYRVRATHEVRSMVYPFYLEKRP
jgi:phage baseplate assembly protein W